MVLVLVSAFAYLRVQWEGPDLGDNIASILNKRMRGRISIGSVEWDTSDLKMALTGGWVKVTIRNVKVWDDCALSSNLDPLDERRRGDPSEDCTPDDKPDPDPSSKRKPRKLLLDAPKITAEIDAHAALFGNHDLYFRHIWIEGGEVLLEQTSEPYPLHAYDRSVVSFISAFYPRMKAGFRAGIYADSAPPKFELRDVHMKDVNLTVHWGEYASRKGVGYSFAARVENVTIDAERPEDDGHAPETYLALNALDPLVAKFYVRLQLKGKHTKIRILDEGPREAFVLMGQRLQKAWDADRSAKYQFELSEIDVNRLAQLPDQWARKDYVANNLELDISAHTLPCATSSTGQAVKDGADIHLTGQLLEWFDRPYDGKWDLQLAVKNLGPTLRTCIKPTMGGDNLNGTIKLSGPFIAAPKVTLDLEGLDFDVPLSKQEEPLRLTLAEVHGDIDLVNEQGSIDRTKAQIRNGKEPGEVMVAATFQLKPWRVKTSVDITKPIDIGRFLPPKTVAAAGKFLQGKLTAEGDSEYGFELKDFDLALGRTEKEKAIVVHKGRIFTDDDFEVIHIQKVAVDAGRNHATFDGWVNTVKEKDNIDLSINGCFPELGVWLARFNLPRFAESACGGAQPPPPVPQNGASMQLPQGGVVLASAHPSGGGTSPSSNNGTTIHITGNYKNPSVNLSTTLGGVPCMDNLGVNATFENGVATIHSIVSTGLGGTVTGNGRILLPEGGMPRIEKLHIEGRGLDGSKLCGLNGVVKGTINTLDVDVKPTDINKNKKPMDWLASFQVAATAKKITALGETYSNAQLCINRNDDGKCRPTWANSRLAPDAKTQCEQAKKTNGSCIVASADRDLGGRFAATIADVPPQKVGRVSVARQLGGTIALDDLPVAVLQPLIGPGEMGGLVSATLHLGGDRDAPQVAIGSTINLTRAWVAGAYIGDTQLGVIPSTYNNQPAVRVYGQAMAGQIGIDGFIGTSAPYSVDVALRGRRIEVDHFVDLTKKLGFTEPLQAWATGTVTLRTDLDKKSTRQPEAWVELDEVEAIMNHRTQEGRQQPIRFSFVPPPGGYALSARLTKTTVELACRAYGVAIGRKACPATLVTPAGNVAITGGVTQSQMLLEAHGELDLRRVAPLLENQVEDIAGTLDLNGTVSGTFAKPTYDLSLDVTNVVSLRLPGGDAVLQVLGPHVEDNEQQPGAHLELKNGSIFFQSFALNVRDERKDEQGELNIGGSLDLKGLSPARWSMTVEGKIAGKMLSALMPSKIAQATGLARIDGTLSGEGALPLVDAQLTFDPEEGSRAQPLAVVPRGVRRELSMLAGVVDITTQESGSHRTYTVDFRDDPLTMTIDNDGKVDNIRGRFVLTDEKLDYADLALDAENIPYAVPGTLDLILSAKNVHLELPASDAAWKASGNIAIVNGRYKRNFELTEVIKPAPEVAQPVKPFWAEYPSIGNADLDLAIEVRRFAVENNITPTPIELAGPRLLLRGSPREPRLAGTIRVQRGEFKIPATRAKFTNTTGSIDFAENEKVSNPSLNITSDAPDYVDLSGTPHTITMQITGTLENPQWDLRTSTGYNKSQTLALLFLGRSPEQLRRSLGDTTLATNDPTRGAGSTSTNPGGVGDTLVRDLAGDWVSSLLGNSLTRITRLDVLRFEIGFGSVGVSAKKKLLDNLNALFDAEQTVRGNTVNIRGDLFVPLYPAKFLNVITTRSDERASIQGGYLSKNFNDPAEIDVHDAQAKLVYKLFIP